MPDPHVLNGPGTRPFRGRGALSRLRAAVPSAVTAAVNAVQGALVVPRPLRWVVLRAWGVGVATPHIGPGCWFGGRDVRIGAGTFVNFGCVFDNLAPIRVGAKCHFGMRAMLLTSTHEVGTASQRAGAVAGKPIVVGDGCWIGAGAILLPGVSVGAGCIVASGSVVTHDCEPNGLYGGVPARRLRDLERDPVAE